MKQIQRIIIKVGSSSLVLKNGNINNDAINELINTINELMLQGKEVALHRSK